MTPARKKSAAKKPAAKKKAKRSAPTPRPDEMSEEVMEFIAAIDDYKRANQRPFPTWSEVLQILKDMGYEREAG